MAELWVNFIMSVSFSFSFGYSLASVPWMVLVLGEVSDPQGVWHGPGWHPLRSTAFWCWTLSAFLACWSLQNIPAPTPPLPPLGPSCSPQGILLHWERPFSSALLPCLPQPWSWGEPLLAPPAPSGHAEHSVRQSTCSASPPTPAHRHLGCWAVAAWKQ